MAQTNLQSRDNGASVTDETRWAAVVEKDPRFDGSFVYAVATTGVYCRPSCPARPAKRVNVRFHATCAEAEAAGFRPCKRCRPNGPSRDEACSMKVAAACRLIETSEEEPSLRALAQAVGLSTSHFHRIFKSIAGVTPKAYAIAYRRKRIREHLPQSETVTAAIYGAGFNSNGRFYATSSEALGMTPSDFRSGGRKARIRFAVGPCSLGEVLIAASAKGICAVLFGDDADALVRDLQDRFPKAEIIGSDAEFERIVAAVIALVETPGTDLHLPLDVRGTAFQHRVWRALRDIRPGTTANYADIAKRIGKPAAARAVARACAANSLAVLIPCHRVVRSDGGLSGYRWGVERKRELLDREAKSAKPGREGGQSRFQSLRIT